MGADHRRPRPGVGEFAPSYLTFIAVVPVLLYSFVGIELPAAAAEEMVDPRRDIPAAIARAGIAQLLMYALPILAVLVVLPTEQVTSLHGLIDAMKTVVIRHNGEGSEWSLAYHRASSCGVILATMVSMPVGRRPWAAFCRSDVTHRATLWPSLAHLAGKHRMTPRNSRGTRDSGSVAME